MNGHGPNVTEAKVMALWDGGWSMERIAAEIGMSRRYVGMVVSMLDASGADDRAQVAAIRAADAHYAAALAATGNRYA